MPKHPAPLHFQNTTAQGATAGTVIDSCPPPLAPIVYVVPETPWPWLILTGLLVAGWIRSVVRGRRSSNKIPSWSRITAQPIELPPDAQPVSHESFSETRRALEGALRNFQMKPAEIRARLAPLDMSLPVDVLVASVLKGIGKGEAS